MQQRASLVSYTVPSFFSHDPDVGINREALSLVRTLLLLEKGRMDTESGLHEMPSQATRTLHAVTVTVVLAFSTLSKEIG